MILLLLSVCLSSLARLCREFAVQSMEHLETFAHATILGLMTAPRCPLRFAECCPANRVRGPLSTGSYGLKDVSSFDSSSLL
jgi:hypothetical protein